MPVPASNPSAGDSRLLRQVDRLCQVSLFMLLATGFYTLAATGKLDTVCVMFVSAALLVRGFMLLARKDWRIPERWTSYLGFLYFLGYLADYFWISRSFLVATVHLVLFGMVIKLFSVERYRDLLYLAILAFLEVLAAAILTVETSFLGTFILFVFIAIGSFIALEIRRSVGDSQANGAVSARPEPETRHLYRALAGITVAQALGIMLCATLIFFALPRLSAGYLHRFAQHNDLMTAFSDRIRLGEIGRVQESSEVVMHVKFDGPGPAEFRLRGATLANFDGQSWSGNPATTVGVSETRVFNFPVRSLPPEAHFATGRSATLVEYHVKMEPVGVNVIFVVPKPLNLVANLRRIVTNFDQSVESSDRFLSNYSGVSDISRPTPEELTKSGDGVPSSLPSRYLRMPEGLDPRISVLAGEIAGNHHSVYEKAAAIELFLSTRFGYTLERPSQAERDPVGHFLFERKKGHCEYFASAMALMLRAQGIPSRIVTGFHGGEFNDLTGSYIIRGRHAHAWVEAYIPGRGWLAFDPTPGGEVPPTHWDRLRLYLDAANEFWRDWVVNYDDMHQQALAATGIDRGRKTGERFRKILAALYSRALAWGRDVNRSVSVHPRRYQSLGMALLAIALSLGFARDFNRWWRRRIIAAQPARNPKHAATIFYEKMTSATGGRGWRREPYQTPGEFVSAIHDAELRRAVERFTAHYERARYADSAEDAQLLPDLLRKVEAAGEQRK